jgi:ketosteroid isomerase-like protein
MSFPEVRQSFLPPFALLAALAAPAFARAQEIPLEYCDALPVIKVAAAGRPAWFLVDTAATSMLNLESFTQGTSRDIRVTSWSGTLATSAKEITLSELVVGQTKLVKFSLPAIDLSAIGKACGRKIDGILGVDLLGKMGATIDLQRQMLRIRTAEEERSAALAEEMLRDTHGCLKAFNDSDEQAFGDCLDPRIALFTAQEELHGREKVIGYFRDRYFHQTPAAQLELRESSFHAIGEAVWYEYEFTIDSERGRLHGQGMAMCKKSDGHWRMASMHHSVLEYDAAVSSKRKPPTSDIFARNPL